MFSRLLFLLLVLTIPKYYNLDWSACNGQLAIESDKCPNWFNHGEACTITPLPQSAILGLCHTHCRAVLTSLEREQHCLSASRHLERRVPTVSSDNVHSLYHTTAHPRHSRDTELVQTVDHCQCCETTIILLPSMPR